MTEEELSGNFSTGFEDWHSRHWGDIVREEQLYDQVMNLSLQRSSGSVAFRAAYSLELAFFRDPDGFAPYHARFISDFCEVTHPGVLRHYGKIMAWLLKNRRLDLTDGQALAIAEIVVARLVDPELKVAVKAWCMDILHHLSGRLDWVQELLPEVIDQLKRDPSPGMLSRLKKLGWIKGKK